MGGLESFCGLALGWFYRPTCRRWSGALLLGQYKTWPCHQSWGGANFPRYHRYCSRRAVEIITSPAIGKHVKPPFLRVPHFETSPWFPPTADVSHFMLLNTHLDTGALVIWGLIERSFAWGNHLGNHQKRRRLSPLKGNNYP